jgi:hypothetical protein
MRGSSHPRASHMAYVNSFHNQLPISPRTGSSISSLLPDTTRHSPSGSSLYTAAACATHGSLSLFTVRWWGAEPLSYHAKRSLMGYVVHTGHTGTHGLRRDTPGTRCYRSPGTVTRSSLSESALWTLPVLLWALRALDICFRMLYNLQFQPKAETIMFAYGKNCRADNKMPRKSSAGASTFCSWYQAGSEDSRILIF